MRVSYPATAVVTAVTAVAGASQLLSPAVVEYLQRDRAALLAGQWWRLVTPLTVAPSGIGQYAINLAGLVFVGIATERLVRPGRWLAVYFGAGLAGLAFSYLAFPSDTGGGSSDGVAGLIGLLVLTWLANRVEPWWPGYLYGAFFVAYLAGLAFGGAVAGTVAGGAVAGGVVAGTVAGGASIATVVSLRRHGPARRTMVAVVVLVIAGAAVLLALRDDHGVGLTAGFLIALIWRPGSVPAAHPVDRAGHR